MANDAARCGRFVGVSGICLSLFLITPASAQTSASFQVSATIVPGCEINGSPPVAGQGVGQVGVLDFGTHSALDTGPISVSLAQNAGLTFRCTPAVALTMALGGGLHAGNSRNVQETGGARLAYRLFRDAGFTQELAADQPIAVSFSGSGAVALPIYATLNLGAGNRPGTYTDTVVVTLAW